MAAAQSAATLNLAHRLAELQRLGLARYSDDGKTLTLDANAAASRFNIRVESFERLMRTHRWLKVRGDVWRLRDMPPDESQPSPHIASTPASTLSESSPEAPPPGVRQAVLVQLHVVCGAIMSLTSQLDGLNVRLTSLEADVSPVPSAASRPFSLGPTPSPSPHVVPGVGHSPCAHLCPPVPPGEDASKGLWAAPAQRVS